MGIKNIFKRKPKFEEHIVRTWDIQFLKEFFHNYKEMIKNLSIGIYEDEEIIPLFFIKNNEILNLPEYYKTTKTYVDGIYYTLIGTPCIFVEFNNGVEMTLECYVEGVTRPNDTISWFTGSLLDIHYRNRSHQRID